MNDVLKFWIPVIISIIAIIFTGRQQFISNKQFLFDKRLYLYQLYKILLIQQKNVEFHFSNESANDFCAYDMIIAELTNDNILESSINGWNDRDGGALMKTENHKSFLSMIEKLRSYGTESSFIFSGKCGQKLYEYFNKYADLCSKTYKYSILMKNIEKENEQLCKINQTIPFSSKINRQQSLHIELNQIYTDLCKLSDSIKLSDLEKSISFIMRTNYENNTDSNHNYIKKILFSNLFFMLAFGLFYGITAISPNLLTNLIVFVNYIVFIIISIVLQYINDKNTQNKINNLQKQIDELRKELNNY